jgi:hypothetical protein
MGSVGRRASSNGEAEVHKLGMGAVAARRAPHLGQICSLDGDLEERGKIQPPREVEYRLDRDVVQEWRTKTF